MLKCLVLDLDNTIWGGVVGEDGVEGIRLTPEYLEVQQVALELRERGILLAVCSKNNDNEAFAALRRPEMKLRLRMLADWRINWQHKAVNLREIAGYLNIGLDSIAFVDDSPTERGLIKAQLPEVTVIELPDGPAGYATAIRAAFATDATVTEEDVKRSGYYTEQKRRMEAEQQAASLEEFLHSLSLVLEVGRATSETIPRIAQLSQRTNQFTLTGRKYSEQEITAFCEDGQHNVYWGRLRDIFGDYGIIAAAITWAGTSSYEEFWLSCRAMGRDVEIAFLIATMVKGEQLFARPVKTNRNVPAQECFGNLTRPVPKAPPWIKTRFVCQNADRQIDGMLGYIRAIAGDVFGLTGDDLSAISSPSNTPEWDSLAAVNLILALEDEFKIVFTAEEMETAPNLGELAEMVQKKRKREANAV